MERDPNRFNVLRSFKDLKRLKKLSGDCNYFYLNAKAKIILRTWKVLRTFEMMPRPKSSLDCVMCISFARQQIVRSASRTSFANRRTDNKAPRVSIVSSLVISHLRMPRTDYAATTPSPRRESSFTKINPEQRSRHQCLQKGSFKQRSRYKLHIPEPVT